MSLVAIRICTLILLLAACESADQLPPDIQADRYRLQAKQAMRGGHKARARDAMERLVEIEQEHELEPEEEDYYRYALTWEWVGEPQRAMAAAVRYLQLQGREAEYYTEALDLINRAESAKAAAEASAEATRRRAEAVDHTVIAAMEFAWVPAGEFLMGSTSVEAGRDEQPLTRVRISRGFWLGKYEMTQGQWQAVMATNPAAFRACGPDCPVENVSWNAVQEFIATLNAAVGEERYRLPTEVEWKYAARAGTNGDRYSEDLDAIAWHAGNSGDRTHPVGQKVPNGWGLHDMLGNVMERVEGIYSDYPGGNVVDPQGSRSGSHRGIRGGSWNLGTSFCRVSYRSSLSLDDSEGFIGFRLLKIE